MDALRLVAKLPLGLLPCSLANLIVGELVEDTVTPKDDKIVVVFDLEAHYVWLGDNNFRVAAILDLLGLNVTEGSRDGKPTWEDSVGSKRYLLAPDWSSVTGTFLLVGDALQALSLVDLPTAVDNSLVLAL